MLTITPTAAEAINALVQQADAPEGSGLRIASQGQELPDRNQAASLEVTLAREPAEADEVVEQEGARLFVAPDAAEFLADKQLDAQVDGQRVGFTLSDQVG